MYQVLFETPLETIKGISGESIDSFGWDTDFPKETVINANNVDQTYRLARAPIELVKPFIENAIITRKEEIDSDRKREKIHVMLDFSFLRTYMEKGGLVMQMLKCPYCGGSVALPKTGNQIKCSHCGKTIYAQDIFEKVKNLI
jgi:ribosomal protein S27AE